MFGNPASRDPRRSLLLVGKTITEALDGLDALTPFVAELLAQASDVHVDGPGQYFLFIAPDIFKKELAGEYAARLLHHDFEKPKLFARKLDRLPIHLDAVLGQIEHHLADEKDF